MKINELSNNIGKIGNLETAANKQKEEETKASQAQSASLQPSERVDFSSASVEFSNASEKMEKTPDERAERIAALKTSVSNGTYNVDSAKIAERIINDSLFNG
jgi:negative regulator of flagellin synthesis FlgM